MESLSKKEKNDNENVANINEKSEKGVISKNVIDQREKKWRNWWYKYKQQDRMPNIKNIVSRQESNENTAFV